MIQYTHTHVTARGDYMVVWCVKVHINTVTYDTVHTHTRDS